MPALNQRVLSSIVLADLSHWYIFVDVEDPGSKICRLLII